VNPMPSMAAWLELLGVLAAGACLIAALAAVVARALRSAAWRRTVWQVATVALVVLVMIEVTGVGRGLAPWLAPRPAADRTALPAEPARSARAAASAPLHAATPSHDVSPARSADAEKPSRGIRHARTPARGEQASPGAVTSPALPDGPGWWPGCVWLLGTAIVLARVLAARVFLIAFRRRHRSSADEALLARVRRIARRLGLRPPVRVLACGRLSGPIAFGILRPTVGLPRGFTRDLPPAAQDAMLSHELAHLAGRDPTWSLLADLATAALWWHPAAWLARRRFQAACEAAADEGSLVVAGGPELLATCLVALARRIDRPRALAWLGADGAGPRSGLGRRVEQLLELGARPWRRPSRFRIRLFAAAGLVALIAPVLMSTAWARPEPSNQGDSNMGTIRSAWKHSVAGVVVLAAVGLGPQAAPAEEARRGEGEGAPEVRKPVAGDRESERPRVREGEGERRGEGERPRVREGEAERPRGEGERPRVREGEAERPRGEGERPRVREGEGEGRRPAAQANLEAVTKDHRLRLERLGKLREIVAEKNNDDLLAFVNSLIEEENARYEKFLKEPQTRRAARGEGDRPRAEGEQPRAREGEGERPRGEGERPRVREGEGDRPRVREGEGERPRVREGEGERRIEGDRPRGEGDRPRVREGEPR